MPARKSKGDAGKFVFDFESLPEGFVLAKPIQREAYDPEVLEELEKEGRLLKTRKRDGWKLFALFNKKGKARIFTDGLRDVSDRVPHLVKELESLGWSKTLLVGEGVMVVNGKDERTAAQSVLNSGPKRALEVQEELGLMRFVTFDIIFSMGVCVLDTSYKVRLASLKDLGLQPSLKHVSDVEVVDETLETAKKMVVEKKWEGLVLYDSEFRSSFRLDGKSPERVKGCYKWKPIYEDDFIVRRWLASKTDPERMKEVELLQIDPKTGKEFSCGKLGGFSNDMREKLKKIRYPIVMQVNFDGRFASGKLDNARFADIRKDKKPKDCVAPKGFTPESRNKSAKPASSGGGGGGDILDSAVDVIADVAGAVVENLGGATEVAGDIAGEVIEGLGDICS